MSLLFCNASSIASCSVNAICSSGRTPMRSPEGSGRRIALKSGATGGGSGGRSAGFRNGVGCGIATCWALTEVRKNPTVNAIKKITEYFISGAELENSCLSITFCNQASACSVVGEDAGCLLNLLRIGRVRSEMRAEIFLKNSVSAASSKRE